MFIDSHAHLDYPDYTSDLEAVLQRAADSRLRYIITVGTDVASSRLALELAHKYDMLYAAVGIHPHDASKAGEQDWRALSELVKEEKVVAVGETGLDYYRNLSPAEVQQEAFRRQLEIARSHDLPVIIHCRQAQEAVLSILGEERYKDLVGVMHCFSGSQDDASRSLDLGFYISFAGQLTFPKADALCAVAQSVPIERTLIETDAPYLAPQPRRGKRNEPAYVRYTAQALADVHTLSLEDIGRITSLNAQLLFCMGEIDTRGRLAYPIGDVLYLNITNQCSNRCSFCIRNISPFVKGHFLKFAQEPTFDEILQAIADPTGFSEVVFCGYGEPTMRLDILKQVARYLKGKGARVRLDTNGQGDLINGKKILPELGGLIDALSISLNTASPTQYNSMCRPSFGKRAYAAILEFIKQARDLIGEVEVTAVEMPAIDLEACRRLAVELGVGLRVRRFSQPLPEKIARRACLKKMGVEILPASS